MTAVPGGRAGAPAGAILRQIDGLSARTRARRSADALRGSLSRGAWIYGAGGYGRRIRALLAREGIPCRGFLDRRPIGPMDGLAVRAPEDVDAGEIAGAGLVVAVHNCAADPGPILRWAESLPFAVRVWPGDLPDLLGPGAATYWLAGRAHPLRHRDAVERFLGMLDDAGSIEVVAALLRHRMTGDPSHHPAVETATQYRPEGLLTAGVPIRFVDGGAFVGDTIEALTAAGIPVAEWYAFEPDPDAFARLAEAAARRSQGSHLFPAALGAARAIAGFAADGAGGSSLIEVGSAAVPVVALDEVLAGAPVDYVKLDVEGSEAAALTGMRETLRRHRPRLAVSLYHRPDDLWTLPALVEALRPGSRLSVRQHGFNGFDTVLYAQD